MREKPSFDFNAYQRDWDIRLERQFAQEHIEFDSEDAFVGDDNPSQSGGYSRSADGLQDADTQLEAGEQGYGGAADGLYATLETGFRTEVEYQGDGKWQYRDPHSGKWKDANPKQNDVLNRSSDEDGDNTALGDAIGLSGNARLSDREIAAGVGSSSINEVARAAAQKEADDKMAEKKQAEQLAKDATAGRPDSSPQSPANEESAQDANAEYLNSQAETARSQANGAQALSVQAGQEKEVSAEDVRVEGVFLSDGEQFSGSAKDATAISEQKISDAKDAAALSNQKRDAATEYYEAGYIEDGDMALRDSHKLSESIPNKLSEARELQDAADSAVKKATETQESDQDEKQIEANELEEKATSAEALSGEETA